MRAESRRIFTLGQTRERIGSALARRKGRRSHKASPHSPICNGFRRAFSQSPGTKVDHGRLRATEARRVLRAIAHDSRPVRRPRRRGPSIKTTKSAIMHSSVADPGLRCVLTVKAALHPSRTLPFHENSRHHSAGEDREVGLCHQRIDVGTENRLPTSVADSHVETHRSPGPPSSIPVWCYRA